MKLLCVSVALLSITVVTVSGHKHQGHEAISYSIVTKHEDKHDHHDHKHVHQHDIDHHEHHASHVSHDHHAHKSHHEHKVEHHGNNDHDHDHDHDHHHGHGHYEHHGHHHVDHHEHHDKHSHPKYEFKYGVKDPKTGDVKQQWEKRDGDSVKGSYSFKEADGTTRIVNYTSDKKKGFEATVHKIGHAHKGHLEHSSHY